MLSRKTIKIPKFWEGEGGSFFLPLCWLLDLKKKVKQSRYRPGVVQRLPGS
jgi:hypothetical protein